MALVLERNREWYGCWLQPGGRLIERRLPARSVHEARAMAEEIELLARDIASRRPTHLQRRAG